MTMIAMMAMEMVGWDDKNKYRESDDDNNITIIILFTLMITLSKRIH